MRRTIALVLWLTSGLTAAQGTALPTFSLQRVQPDPSGVGGLTVGSGELLAPGSFRVNLGMQYERDPLVLYQGDARVGAIVRDRTAGYLSVAAAVHRRLELGVIAPVLLHQEGDSLAGTGFEAVASGPGVAAPWVDARVGLLSELEGEPMGLALHLGVNVPLGNPAQLVTDRAVAGETKILMSKRLGMIFASGELGLGLRPRASTLVADVGPQLLVAATVSTFGPWVRGEVSLRASHPLSGEGAVEGSAGVRLRVRDGLELYVLNGMGLGAAAGTPLYRVIAGLAYSSAPAIGEDPCQPGHRHSPAECPNLDDDEDGVLNRIDDCPSEAGTLEGRGCRPVDADGDGVADLQDRCPRLAGEARYAGCPMSDADQDGLADDQDACPASAGPLERMGCPIKDADGDGVEDSADACPTDPGTARNHGCPVRDADADGVTDALDNCPRDAGPASNQGCPTHRKQLVVITRKKLEIHDKIYFASNQARILPRSFPLLDQVAQVIAEHPAILQVTIEGHTDDRGNPRSNRALSQTRADAVRAYLIRQKIDPARLEALGVGADRPTASNATAAGREANRRVEFTITSVPSRLPAVPSSGASEPEARAR